MTDADTDRHRHDAYEPPSLTTIGTLSELTQGEGVAEEDNFGGFENSTPPT